jgi:hypothetical protein
MSLGPEGVFEDHPLIVSFTVTFRLETVVASWPALVTLDASLSTCYSDEVRDMCTKRGWSRKLTEAASLGSLPDVRFLLMRVVSASVRVCLAAAISIRLSGRGNHGVRPDVARRRDGITHVVEACEGTRQRPRSWKQRVM